MTSFEKVYRLIETKEIEEVRGTASVYEHIRSGAHVFTIKNDDANKVFYIGFRTVPEDDTGAAHILEHSVLCGSEKFPLKDPFIELAKGSLNTFLNAMTYPDKTVYPVASCNDKDFANLMDVYLDAVLHPNIYREPKIFQQEGWHYELSEESGELSYNGVVYNEMKGAFSNPESVLERYTMHALFPDTSYANESGGAPESIPKLSYEAFLDFHRKYYHPSNSYLYLYGDMDMEERLLWIDSAYLSAYERQEPDSGLCEQKPFSKPKKERIEYPVGDSEPLERRSYLSENFVVGGELSAEEYAAWQILEFVLLEAPGAPLKEALIEAGIGEDIFGGCMQGILQPYFSVVAKNADEKDSERFFELIQSTVRALCEKGIEKKSLQGALNYIEFKNREADYGRTPEGLIYGLTALESWLYGGSPYLHICYADTIRFLKAQIGSGYFEALLQKGLLDNPFRASVTVVPKRGLGRVRDEALRAELSAYCGALGEEERLAVIEENKALLRYQEEPAADEALRTLPILKIGDIGKKAEAYKSRRCGRLLWSDIPTNGISYLRVLFDTSELTEEELSFASFLCSLYGELDTDRHDYRDLNSEILLRTGGVDFDMGAYPLMDGSRDYRGFLYGKVRVLHEEIGFGLSVLSEILTGTSLSDEKRIGEKLLEAKSRMQMKLDGRSHSAAVIRAGSYFRKDQRFEDLTGGIAYYDFLNAASKFYQLPSKRKNFLKSLKRVSEKLFVRKNVSFALAGSREDKRRTQEEIKLFTASLPKAKAVRKRCAEEKEPKLLPNGKPMRQIPCCYAGKPEPSEIPARGAVTAQGIINEGMKTSSQVNYVARCGSFAEKKLPYTGALSVLSNLLNYEYLWQNLRVKGGAYGCMSGFTRSGRAYLVSYRDPKIAATNEVYEKLPQYLRELSLTERDMTKYIIGAIAELDQPVTAAVKAARSLSAYLSGVENDALQKEREEILSCTAEDLRALVPYVEAMLSTGAVCTIGNAEQISAEPELFGAVRELY